jgi:succinyl-CoA synthetase beta subunit
MRLKRFLKLYEYEAKNILTQYGIPVPQGTVVTNANRTEAE